MYAHFEANCPYSVGQTWDYNYSGNSQKFEVPCKGTYKLEAYGAQGGGGYGSSNAIGLGGYTTGVVYLPKSTNLFIFVGQRGYAYSSFGASAWNGGGASGGIASDGISHYGGGGGGATDFRIADGTWNNNESLKSRILVAGGGGGAHSTCGSVNGSAGHGGGLNGATTFNYGSGYYGASSSGGSQTSGGTGVGNFKNNAREGGFGYGAPATQCGAGAGGGWYGGGSEYTANGGGGSSYISGYSGCNTLYLEYQKINGNNLIFSSISIEQGKRTGDGYAKITLMSVDIS